MSFILDLMKPSAPVEEVQDKGVVAKKYRYWRIRIFYSMYVGYVFYYFTRKSLAFAMPMMIKDLGFDKSQLGLLGSILALSYGMSKFVSGIISDKSNPRFFMAFGLIITGILNIFFGLSSTIFLFAIFWGLNGWFQGFGWPPCSRLLSHWYSKSERGAWWSFWSTSHNLGGAIIPWVATHSAYYFGWRYAMFVPGVISIFAGFFVLNRLRDTPQSLGLPTIEKFREEHTISEKESLHLNKTLSFKEMLFKYVLTNGYIWMLAFSSVFVYIIRTAMNDWTTLYLIEKRGFSLVSAGSCVFWFESGGFVGMLVAGWLSDRLYASRRGPMNVIFSLGMFVSILGFWLYPGTSLLWNSFICTSIGFFLFGPQMLIGLAAAELSHKNATGTATGFTGWFAYLGAAIAGYPLGLIAEKFGWQGFFIMMAVCGVLSIFCFLPLWGVSSSKVQDRDQQEMALTASESTSS